MLRKSLIRRNKSMYFEVDEIQILTAGGSPVALPSRFFTDVNEAWSAYYTVLAAAAVSTIPYHEARIMELGTSGIIFERKVFDRRDTEE